MGTINIGEDGSSLYILFDNIRWEEKSIIEKAKQYEVDIKPIDCKDLVLFLNEDSKKFHNRVILQRCVSYFRSLHSTGYSNSAVFPGARLIFLFRGCSRSIRIWIVIA